MDYVLHILIMTCLYVILATSFNLLIGFAGLFALSQAAFYACGAYATAILTTSLGLPFPLPTLIGAVAAGGFGMITALPALRVGGHYLVIVTLALQIILVDILLNVKPLTGGTEGITGIAKISLSGWTLGTPARFLPLAAAVAVLCFWVAHRIAVSPFGRALRAMRENEEAAQALGKNIVAMKLTVFVVSAGLSAVAGSLLAHYIGYVGPNSFTVDETIYILAMVIVGGLGNLWGSLAGAVLLVGMPELLKFVELPTASADMVRSILYGLILIGILRLRPQGLIPERAIVAVPPGEAAAIAAEPMLTVTVDPGARLSAHQLFKNFGGVTAVDGLDVELSPGTITGLIGPNGAGKTTAFNLLTGFLKSSAGDVRYRGRSLNGLKPHEIVRARIARSFQDLKLFRRMSVLENVLVALPDQRGDRLWAVLFEPRQVRLDEARNIARAKAVLRFVKLDGKLLDRADSLSFAEEKLLAIARLLATGAEVLLLDEPLSGLDPATVQEILPVVRALAAEGRAICIIEHNLDIIRDLCDTAIYLDEGRVRATGTPEQLMADAALAERYFG